MPSSNDAPSGAPRWTPLRKRAVLDDLLAGRRDRAQTLRLYDLSPAELDEWLAGWRDQGLAGLAVTKRRRVRPAAAEATG